MLRQTAGPPSATVLNASARALTSTRSGARHRKINFWVLNINEKYATNKMVSAQAKMNSCRLAREISSKLNHKRNGNTSTKKIHHNLGCKNESRRLVPYLRY